MNYLLAVLTHGDNDPLVSQALDAFYEHVHPTPNFAVVHRDREPQLGFCGATAALWAKCAAAPYKHVFWLEHDFLVARPVDLRDLAAVLDAEPMLAQLALMRDAYSDEEKAAGGLFEYRCALGDFEPRISWFNDADVVNRSHGYRWLEQSFFTTNPSLMRRDFMAAHPFLDDGQPHCEGRFGIALREQGWQFGTWGSGEVWAKHVGYRDGSGHGY